jgi:outer membrane protein assembly factor BamB
MQLTFRGVWWPWFLAAASLWTAAVGVGDDWPQWRGPKRDGCSAETGLLKTWPAGGPPLAWKADGLGLGYVAVSVVVGRVFTAGDVGEENFVFAMGEANGRVLWSSRVGKAGAPGWGGFAGPRCTPTVDGERLYFLGQYGEVVCLETGTGKEVWRRHLVKDFGGKLPEWGYSESPLVDGDRLVMTPGGPQGTLLALDKRTGAPMWQTRALADEPQYASVIRAEIAGVPQYIQLTMASVVGVAPADGAVLWRAPRKGATAVIPTPVVQGALVYVTSGYGTGSQAFRVAKDEGGFKAVQAYSNKVMVNHHGGAILVGDHIYGYSDGKGWTCQKAATGEAVWQEKAKLDKGSLTYADGRFYLREERKSKSAVALIEASPEGYREVGRFQPPDQSGSDSWPHPVVANGRLYLRDQATLLCYEVKAR